MSISFVQSKSGNAASLAYTSNVTAGNLLVVCIENVAANVSGISDTQGNTWNNAVTLSSGIHRIYIYYAIAGSTGANTVTYTNAAGDKFMAIHEYSGALATLASVLDSTVTAAANTSQNPNIGTCNVNNANSLVVGFWGSDISPGSSTAGTGFTQRENINSGPNASGHTEDGIFSSNASVTFGSGSSVNWAGAAASFKPASSVFNKTASNTLTLTQTLSPTPVHFGFLTSTLTLTETQSELHVAVGSVSESLTFTQSFPLKIKTNVNSTLTLTSTPVPFGNYSTTPSNTLTLTQTQTTQNVLNPHVASGPFISQIIGTVNTLSFDVLHNLSISQHLPLILEPAGIEEDLTFTQTLAVLKSKPGLLSQTLTLTQTIVELKVSNLLVNSTLPISQPNRIPLNYVLNRTVSQGPFISQVIVERDGKNVTSTLTLTGTATAVLAKKVTNTLSLTQTYSAQLILGKTVNALLQPFQTVTRRLILNKSVTSTLSITEHQVGFAVKGVRSDLVLTQTIVETNSKRVKNVLTFANFTFVNTVLNTPDNDFLELSQETLVTLARSGSHTDVFAMDQFIKATKVYSKSATNTLTLADNNVRVRYFPTLTSMLSLTQTPYGQHVVSPRVSSMIHLTQSVNINTALARSVLNNLAFAATHDRLFGGHTFTLPNVQVLTSESFTILRGVSDIVVLPNPQFGDGQGNTGEFTVRYAVNGKPYTYVKNNANNKLNYTFYLSRRKCRELEVFLEKYQASLVELQNWKGEIWKVFITNNPFEFTANSRYANCKRNDSERWDVSLEFEGVKLN